MIFILFLSLLAGKASAECANGCNGHGVCTEYDMCICDRSWQANDCSERICQFGIAFVDTPKGDLDASGFLEGPTHIVSINSALYPYGTSETFPLMEDSNKDVIQNSAHGYMECSNSGLCNRLTGQCECFEGFDGAACQRVSCPGYPDDLCSGHGVCASIKQTAMLDFNNTYDLWDKNTIYGCICDDGYSGGDCSLRQCRSGLDPTYLFDDSATVRFPVYNLALMTTSSTFDFSNGMGGAGSWALTFYDLFGRGWTTDSLSVGATCSDIITALEALPRGLVPRMMTSCLMDTIAYLDPLNVTNTTLGFQETYLSKWIYVQNDTFTPKNDTVLWKPTFWEAGFHNSYDLASPSDARLTGYIYQLTFQGNPGAAIAPKIETYLGNDMRPSLYSSGELITKVWSDGEQGESIDQFPFYCKKVKVQVQHVGSYYYLTGFNATEKLWLQECLGQADLDPALQIASTDPTNIDWDYGSVSNPHILKLVRRSTDRADGGHFLMLYFDTTVTGLDSVGFSDGTFRLINPFRQADNYVGDWYDIFNTKGTLQIVSNVSSAFFDFASKEIYTANLGYDVYGEDYDGDVSCGINPNSPNKTNYVQSCLQKGDMFFLADPLNAQYNPSYLNLYTVNHIYQKPYTLSEGDVLGIWPDTAAINFVPVRPRVRNPSLTNVLSYMTYTITTDVATNWAQDYTGKAAFKIYKFIPSPNNAYNYVTQCSNRGICNTYDGICDCFPGYTGEACSIMDALSI